MAINKEQVYKDGIYETKASFSSILADLDQIIEIATGVAARNKKRIKYAGITIPVAIVVAVVSAIAGIDWLVVISAVAAIVSLGGLIYFLVQSGKFATPRTRVQMAKERIGMLQQDCGTQAPFSLRVGLVPRLARARGTPAHGGRSDKFFEDNWFSLEGKLLDGTVLSDDIGNLTRKRTKSNRRGKVKTKTRVTYLVNVRFSYPKETYGDARAAGKAMEGAVKVGPAAVLRDVRVSEKAIVLKARVSEEMEVMPTAGMLSLGGYRILNLARRIAARQGGSAQ